jgi:hypothetical protein
LRGVFLIESITWSAWAALEDKSVCSKFSIFPFERLFGGAKDENENETD